MRSYNIPPDASGDGAESDFINRTLKRFGEHQFYDTQTVKVEQTTRGVRFHAKIPPVAKAVVPAAKKHPFEIYQPTNYADFATGITFLDSTGTPTVCNIDATKPTDFTAVPPTVNPSESWRFLAVRTGQCEVRPNYSIPVYYDGLANYSDVQDVMTNADDFVGDFIDGYDDPLTTTRNPPLISPVSPSTYPDDFTGLVLWIKITPDTSDSDYPTVAIAGAPAIVPNIFPKTGPNIIPIGVAWSPGSFTASEGFIQQFIFDHARNRFPPGNGNFGNATLGGSGAGGVVNFRGRCVWAFPGDNDPEDLLSQVFYPGDWILEDNDPSITGGSGAMMYQYVGTEPAFIPSDSDGPSDAPYWKPVFQTISTFT